MERLFNENVMREIDGKIVACYSQCRKCKKMYFPPEEHCAACGAEDMDVLPLPDEGDMYSYTVMYRAVKPFTPPHGLAQVQFENGLFIQAIMQIDDPDALEKGNEFEIGSKVKIVTDKIATEETKDGPVDLIGYKAVVQ